MPNNKKESTGRSNRVKKLVRARMAETGEKYTMALRHVLKEKEQRDQES